MWPWPSRAGVSLPPGGAEIDHAAEECIQLLEGGGKIDDCQEAPNPILPEPNELLWGFLSFAALFVLMAKVALPGIRKAMQGRSDKIRSSLDEAERTREEAQAILVDYQRQLADAKGEAGRIIDDARQTAESVKRDLMARAEAEADEQRRRNAEQIAAERDRVMSELQGQVAVLAVEMAERVVEASLDREASLRLIEDYINTVGAKGNGKGNGAGAGAGAGSAAAPKGREAAPGDGRRRAHRRLRRRHVRGGAGGGILDEVEDELFRFARVLESNDELRNARSPTRPSPPSDAGASWPSCSARGRHRSRPTWWRWW